MFLLVTGPYLCDPTGSGDESQNVDCQFQVCLQPIQLHCMNVDLTKKYDDLITHHRGLVRLNEIWGLSG